MYGGDVGATSCLFRINGSSELYFSLDGCTFWGFGLKYESGDLFLSCGGHRRHTAAAAVDHDYWFVLCTWPGYCFFLDLVVLEFLLPSSLISTV